jgi:hypothetical protein
LEGFHANLEFGRDGSEWRVPVGSDEEFGGFELLSCKIYLQVEILLKSLQSGLDLASGGVGIWAKV